MPTTAADDQASPVDLAITYDPSFSWTLNNGHRGLSGANASHAGVASAEVSGTKYVTDLDNSAQASIVFVADWVD